MVELSGDARGIEIEDLAEAVVRKRDPGTVARVAGAEQSVRGRIENRLEVRARGTQLDLHPRRRAICRVSGLPAGCGTS